MAAWRRRESRRGEREREGGRLVGGEEEESPTLIGVGGGGRGLLTVMKMSWIARGLESAFFGSIGNSYIRYIRNCEAHDRSQQRPGNCTPGRMAHCIARPTSLGRWRRGRDGWQHGGDGAGAAGTQHGIRPSCKTFGRSDVTLLTGLCTRRSQIPFSKLKTTVLNKHKRLRAPGCTPLYTGPNTRPSRYRAPT